MPAEVKPVSNLMMQAIAILLLSLMAAGAGFAVGMFVQPGKEDQPEQVASAPADMSGAPVNDEAGTDGNGDAAKATDTDKEDLADANLRIIPLPPVLTTLAAPEGKWVRLESSVLAVPGGEESPELLAERAGEQVLTYLRTVRLEQIQGPSGFLALRDDLNETVRSLSHGELRGLLIHGILVE